MSTDLRRARLDAGLTSTELARRVHISGSYLSLIESGRRRLTPKLREALARHVDLDSPPLAVRLTRAEGEALRWEGLYREVTARLDRALPPCEHFTVGTCSTDPGRSPDSPYTATGYCLPCRIRDLFGITPLDRTGVTLDA